MQQTIETYTVDSFTDALFKGNPAGVCLLDKAIPEKLMLSIAKELGLSETAFIVKLEKLSQYSIRYFSPKMEIPLCGHATLASAKVLFYKYRDLDKIHFVTVQGIDLFIERKGNLIEMEFPIYDTSPTSAPESLLSALGIKELINSEYNSETEILILEIEDSSLLRNLKPDFVSLYNSHDSINGVLVTAQSKKESYDFESRYFWPWSGTNEDPVTGATHTFLAKYWSKRLHKKKMKSFQCSERSGFMEVELISDHQLLIRSTARIVLSGTLCLDIA